MKQTENEQPLLRFYVAWSLIGWGLVGMVIFLSLTSDPIPTPGVAYGDKVGHFIAYFTLTLWFAQLYERRLHWVLMLMFIIMGVALECIQGIVGYRMFQYGDMVANSAGAVLAWALARTALSQMLLRFEQRFFKSPVPVLGGDDSAATIIEPPVLTQQQPRDNG